MMVIYNGDDDKIRIMITILMLIVLKMLIKVVGNTIK